MFAFFFPEESFCFSLFFSHSVEQLKQVPSECVLGFGPVPYEAATQIPLPQQRHLRVPFAPEREQLSQNAPQGNALPQTLHGGEGRTGKYNFHDFFSELFLPFLVVCLIKFAEMRKKIAIKWPQCPLVTMNSKHQRGKKK